jgi:hypothetical protein
VTIEEIDAFLKRMFEEPAGPDYTERIGRKWWHLEHKAGEIYGCPKCRPTFQALANVKHNTVNVHLDKPVVDEKLYRDGVKLIMDTFRKHLEGKHHSENVRIGGRIVHVVSDVPGAIEQLRRVRVSH